MRNNYYVEGEYAYIILKGGKYTTKISLCDLERAKSFKNNWRAHYDKDTGNYYVYGTVSINGKKVMVRLHRYLMQIDDPKEYIDHINHDTLDNTRENINIVSNKENQQNQKKIKGYYWNKQRNKFLARIKVDGKDKHLGYYETEQEAAEAYLKAKAIYHEYYAKISA